MHPARPRHPLAEGDKRPRDIEEATSNFQLSSPKPPPDPPAPYQGAGGEITTACHVHRRRPPGPPPAAGAPGRCAQAGLGTPRPACPGGPDAARGRSLRPPCGGSGADSAWASPPVAPADEQAARRHPCRRSARRLTPPPTALLRHRSRGPGPRAGRSSRPMRRPGAARRGGAARPGRALRAGPGPAAPPPKGPRCAAPPPCPGCGLAAWARRDPPSGLRLAGPGPAASAGRSSSSFS